MKILFALVLLPNLLVADTRDSDPLACVDPVIAAAFLSNYGTMGVPTITRELPDQFSGIRTPTGFEFLGSSVTSQMTTIAFRSDSAKTEAVAIATQLLEDMGWAKVVGPQYSSAGFQAQKMPRVLSFCHEDRGTVTVVSRTFGPDSIISLLSHNYRGQTQSCNQSQPSSTHYRSMDNSILPKLELPESAETRSGMGSSSSGLEASTEIGIVVSMAPEELLGFFGEQIESQEWVFDASWEGDLATGSVWSKRSNKLRFVGILTIITSEENDYSISFTAKVLGR